MSQLQLYIFKSAPTRKFLTAFNGDPEIQTLISDIAPQVSEVRYPSDTKTVFFIAQPLPDGCALHIIRTIPSGAGNFLDAVIYLSYDIDIMADELEELIGLVTDTFMASSVTDDDMNAIADAFSVEYDILDKAPHIKKSPAKGTALLHYGDSFNRSVSDIICAGLYNKPWRAYNSIILIDDTLAANSDAVECLDAELDGETEVPEPVITEELTYNFTLPMNTPEGVSTLEFEIMTTEPIVESPIEGYVTKGKIKEGADYTNSLSPSAGRKFKLLLGKIAWGICGLLAGILLMTIVSMCSDRHNPAPSAPTASIENIN